MPVVPAPVMAITKTTKEYVAGNKQNYNKDGSYFGQRGQHRPFGKASENISDNEYHAGYKQ